MSLKYMVRKIREARKKVNNYNLEMYRVLESLDKKPRILLHTCCAPCSTICLEILSKYAFVTVIYYNPNIEPYKEYLKRKEEEQRFIASYPFENPVEIIDCDYDNEKFNLLAKGLENEPERGKRCLKCYRQRLLYTALKAREEKMDYFATSLTLSPLKSSAVINAIGLEIEKEVGIKYLVSDFKKQNGYKKSIEISKQYQLYRQNYCGCKYSKNNREQQNN